MEALLEILANPVAVVGIAIAIFVVRVLYLAKGLKSAAKNPSLADLRALEDAKKSLNRHRESLEHAKGELTANLESARDTLRHYKAPLNRSVADRRKRIETSLRGLDTYDAALDKARQEQKAAVTRAKRLYKSALPGKGRHAPRDM